MTREEITKEAQEQVNYCTPIHPEDFIHGYVAAAENWQAKYEKQKETNKELADCNSRLLSQTAAATKRIIQLEKENEELKTDKQYWEQKANRLTTEWGETLDQLSQAKKIIKNLLELELLPETKEVKQAEQFLKEAAK